jgi:Concanavalin A-like lectin/glucanases superfamily
MSDSWELICDHTYTGIPGVVVDLSPTGASYGQTLGLDDTDFLKDGASPGSGAVRFYKPGSVYVPTEKAPWRALGAVRGEVTFRRQPAATAFLLDGDTFEFHIRSDALVAWFSSYPVQYAEIVSSFDAVGSQPYQIPVGQWVTLGFMHDGVRTLELYADGAVIARKTGSYAPIDTPGTSGLNIGNTRTLDSPLNGEIDTVRIWRFNPRKPMDDFAGRPMDPKTTECWVHFLRQMQAAFARHPDCAQQMLVAVQAIIEDLFRQANAKGPETQAQLLGAAQTYTQLWRKGHVGGPQMVKVLAELIAWLRLVGLAPDANPALAAFLDSSCLSTVMAEITPPDCDAKVVHLLRSLVKYLEKSGAALA